eukprot:4670193-Prymnesium_polylepis.2
MVDAAAGLGTAGWGAPLLWPLRVVCGSYATARLLLGAQRPGVGPHLIGSPAFVSERSAFCSARPQAGGVSLGSRDVSVTFVWTSGKHTACNAVLTTVYADKQHTQHPHMTQQHTSNNMVTLDTQLTSNYISIHMVCSQGSSQVAA